MEAMIMADRNGFGALVRREREAKKIGLREMAKMLGVSPTYLSMIERGAIKPPAEDRVKGIAAIIGRDPDELLALAGRVASDLIAIIRRRPREMADLLRATKQLTAEQVATCAWFAQASVKRTVERPDLPSTLRRVKQLSEECVAFAEHAAAQVAGPLSELYEPGEKPKAKQIEKS
jgi:transcriptional regulator with XRE-family HTH domain